MWNTYRLNHPTNYPSEVKTILHELEEDLAKGTCACGREQETIQEFQEFVRTFPNLPVSRRLLERIDQIKKGKSDIRWKCISG